MPPEIDETETETQTRAATNKTIRRLAAEAKLDRAVADDLIDRNATLDEARAELFDAVLARQTPTVRHQRIEIGVEHDAPEQLASRMGDALHARLTGTAPSEAGRAFVHYRLVDFARDLLEAKGVRTRMMAPEAILTRATI